VYLNIPLKADLHCHSYFSDGILSPEALLQKALEAKIDLLALTDHDTIDGVERLRDAARQHPITIIDGVELSVRWKMHDIHVLGLNLDRTHPTLLALLLKQNTQRIERAKLIAKRLEETGVQSIFQKACDIAGHERVGRPHLAQVLINEGVVKDMSTAFKKYLGRGKLAYVPTTWLSIDEAVTGILQSGGWAVIAHPLKYKLTRSKLHGLIGDFKRSGGQGIEVVAGEINKTQIDEMAGLCIRFDLLASTGSDYHNESYSRVKLGQQFLLPSNCQPIWEKWIRI